MPARFACGFLAAAAAGLIPFTAVAVGSSNVTFATQSVPGTNGTSYIYFQATETSTGRTSTVPAHRFLGCPTPYYMRWTNVVVHADNSTSYDVELFDCATGQLVVDNVSRAGLLTWRPGSHVVLAGDGQLASGRILYALNADLSPPVVQPNQETTLSASIADDFVAQADRTLNISVDPNGWSVASWSVDFGDGQTATLPGGSPTIQVPHRYVLPNDIKPVVTAHVTGVAQVADFDPLSGNLVLLLAPFSVDVTNSALGQVSGSPVVAYSAPRARAGALSRLQPSPPPAGATGLAAIEAPRGTAVYLYVRPIIDTEGEMTLDGRPAGSGHSEVVSWRLVEGSTDGPPGQVSAAGATGAPGAAIVQQWDSPDQIAASGALPYRLILDFVVRTTYPDGQTRDYSFSGGIAVTVGFAASSG